jgi:hypothetical protein
VNLFLLFFLPLSRFLVCKDNIILLLLSSTNSGQSSILQFAAARQQKRSSSSVASVASGISGITTLAGLPPPSSKKSRTAKLTQLTLLGGVHSNPLSRTQLDIAVADFIHSNLLSFSIAGCPKFQRIIDLAGQVVGQGYKPPHRNEIGGSLLTQLYNDNWDLQIKSLLIESKLFGITVFGDGATIKGVPLVNVLAAGVNNPFALLDVADCTDRAAQAKKKDASYIASLVDPLIVKLENELDGNKLCHNGIVDLVYFDGAKNVQNAGLILAAKHPRITVGHGAEHVVSLFFSDVFNHTKEYRSLSKFYKVCRNIWGGVRHAPSAIFNEHSRRHNGGVNLGFVKPSECRMAGEHIALLRLLRLKDALKSTVTSAEFLALNDFKVTAAVIGNDNFWKYLFLLCRALYAPMRVLRLADQKTPAMDKLYYYVLQADRMLLQYLKDAEEHVSSGALSDVTLDAMTSASGMFEEEYSDMMEVNSGDDDSDTSSDDAEEGMEEEDDEEEFDTTFFDVPNADPLGGGINDSDG